jgi:hypothetical protein
MMRVFGDQSHVVGTVMGHGSHTEGKKGRKERATFLQRPPRSPRPPRYLT